MEAKHEAEIMALVKEHFSSATDGDAKLIWQDVRGLAFDDAHRAVIEHRREKSDNPWRPNIERIKVIAFGHHRNRRREISAEVRTIDYIRREKLPGCECAEGRDAIMMHFGTAWAGVCQSNADPRGKVLAQAFILSHCRTSLRQIGISEKEADDIARDCVDLRSGQKINSIGIFNVEYLGSRESHEEIKKLAYAVRDCESVAEGAGI